MKRLFTLIGLLFVAYLLNGQVKTEVEGGIKIGNTSLLDEGIIRFTGSDFEGRVGSNWHSLTDTGTNEFNTFWVANGNHIYNNNSQNVGIGTNTPTASLDVAFPFGNIHLFQNTSNNKYLGIKLLNGTQNDARNLLQFYHDGLSQGQIYTSYNDSKSAADLVFRTLRPESDIKLLSNSLKAIHINGSNQFIGLGTDTPSEMLHLANSGNILLEANSSETIFNSFNSNGNTVLNIDPNTTSTTGYSAVRFFRTVNSSGNHYFAIMKGDNSTSGVHVLSTKTNSYLAVGSENVGVGITTPNTKLHVSGLIRASHGNSIDEYTEIGHGGANSYINAVGDGDLIFRHDGTNLMTLRDNGFLGLGTINPTQMLHLANSGNILLDNSNTKVNLNSYTGSQGTEVIFQIDPIPADENSYSTIRLFRSVNSTANQSLTIFKGDNSTKWNHSLSSKGDSYLSKLSGKVIIGGEPLTPGNYKLYVDGGIMAEEMKIALSHESDWADDAFEKTPNIDEVESSIKENSHLKDMPSAEFLVNNGYNLREMDADILQQVEWLWMHVIELKKENDDLKSALEELKDK